MADLTDLLDYLAAALPPATPEETARYERRHQRAHERGWCDCDTPPAREEGERG